LKIRVAAIQCRLGDLKSAEKLAYRAYRQGSKIILFPEYFSYSSLDIGLGNETLRFLKKVSSETGTIVCGNIIVKENNSYKNRAFILKDGEIMGYQDKIHPTRIERELGISCGHELNLINVDGLNIGILICADILYPELCRVAGLKGSELILNPVISFKQSELPGKDYRFCLYFARAFDNCCAILKSGGIGKTFTGKDAVGRSLIASVSGILAQSMDENGEEVVRADIDLLSLKKCREVNYSLSDRNVEAYRYLLKNKLYEK